MKHLRRFLPLIILIILTILLFHRGLFNYFFQDDFVHLYLGWVKTPKDLLNLLKPIDYFPYRPLAIQLAGYISVHVFRLHPLPSHILLLFLHLINIILLWKILEDYQLTQFAKSVAVGFYGLSSIHFMLLYWWSILYILLGTSFFLINCLVLHRIGTKQERRYFLVYFLILFLMYLTNEALIIYPLWIILYVFFLKKKKLKKIIFPTIVLTLLFLLVRLNLAKYPQSSDYAIGNLVQILKTAKWYFLRSLNIAEGIKSMDFFLEMIVLIIIGFMSMFIISTFYFYRKYKLFFDRKLTLFGLLWFLILAFPFFLLPNHLSSFYLNTALSGLAVTIGCFFQPLWSKSLGLTKGVVFGVLLLYIVLSFIDVSYLRKNHWVVWRAQIAADYLGKVKKMYPVLPKGVTLVFKETNVKPSEIAVVLSGDKAARLIYNDPYLNVLYDKVNDSIENNYIITD